LEYSLGDWSQSEKLSEIKPPIKSIPKGQLIFLCKEYCPSL
jgi:hypothetical protein